MSSSTGSQARQPSAPMLNDEMLARFGGRASEYDRENRFFSEDFEELRESGHLQAAVPRDFGGGGLNLAEVVRQQRRLAYFAAPTALAVNMHLYWTGIAADLFRAGDTSLAWLLEAAMKGRPSRLATPRAATTFRYCCPPPLQRRRLRESLR